VRSIIPLGLNSEILSIVTFQRRSKFLDGTETIEAEASTTADQKEKFTKERRKRKKKDTKKTKKSINGKTISRRYEKLSSDACTVTSSEKFSNRAPRKEKSKNIKSLTRSKKKKKPQKNKTRGDIATQSNEQNTHPTESRTKTPSKCRNKPLAKDPVSLQTVKSKGIPSTIAFTSSWIDNEDSYLSDIDF